MYTLRFPFRLQASQKLGEDHTQLILDKFSIALSRNDPYCVLTIQGFESELDAKNDIKRV